MKKKKQHLKAVAIFEPDIIELDPPTKRLFVFRCLTFAFNSFDLLRTTSSNRLNAACDRENKKDTNTAHSASPSFDV